MTHLHKLLIGVCLFGYGTTIIAQTTIPATGGNASGSGGTISYSVGQVVYTKNTGTNGSISQGVQQPYEISVITGLEEAKDISLEMGVYPNPANHNITLKIDNYDSEKFSYKLFDINGNLFENERIISGETTISMSTLFPGIYFLQVHDKSKTLKTFKIIKN